MDQKVNQIRNSLMTTHRSDRGRGCLRVGNAKNLRRLGVFAALLGVALTGCDIQNPWAESPEREAPVLDDVTEEARKTAWLDPPTLNSPQSDLAPPALHELPPVPRTALASDATHRQVSSRADLARSLQLAFADSDDQYNESDSEWADLSGGATHSIRLSFGGFEEPSSSASGRDRVAQLVQAPAETDLSGVSTDDRGVESRGAGDTKAGRSASDVGPVEIIPTPEARPEYRAEQIPTPQGSPDRLSKGSRLSQDPVARIAADLKSSKARTKPLSAKATDDLGKNPGAPDLIDPNTELGLVDTNQGPEDYRQWPKPEAVLFITGDQHGYIEPCGCTGLEEQKGGVARRFTFMDQLRSKGWSLVPVDAGNQIRRIGRQASIKFEKSSAALSEMKYDSVGFGPSDMRLGLDLLAYTQGDSGDGAMYVSANVVLFDPEYVPNHKIIKQGEWAIGITSVLDPEALEGPLEAGITVEPIKEAATKALAAMNTKGATFRVLTFYGTEEAAGQLMRDVPGYDVIVVSGGYGEPTYRPQSIAESKTKLIVTGSKGMYAGLVGLYSNSPMKYARVPLSHEFKDAPEMRTLMKDYQQQLEQLGLSGLGIDPIPHASGGKFVGSKKCGECHTTAMEIWESSAHAEATEHLVHPTDGRGDVARHFDPECLSCHVTGWDPQGYRPYVSGYLDLQKSSHLHGNGCENCHGPGAEHSAAEEKGSGVSDERKESLRIAMQLPLERAKEHCMKCHDLDNSPDFHDEDAFEDEYWPEIEHYGVD